jgi:hypothetical protein
MVQTCLPRTGLDIVRSETVGKLLGVQANATVTVLSMRHNRYTHHLADLWSVKRKKLLVHKRVGLWCSEARRVKPSERPASSSLASTTSLIRLAALVRARFSATRTLSGGGHVP